MRVVVNRHRIADADLRTALERVCKRAGVQLWEPAMMVVAIAGLVIRAFGQENECSRYAERRAEWILPKVLMELMRHESIGSTRRFYVGQNAQRTADAAWAAYETVQARQQSGKMIGPVNTSVNSQAPAVPAAESENETSPCDTRACESWGIRI
ncbi:MAG: hypothetical protein ABSE63_14675 [Thermoguttaceae bacterium]